MFGLTPVRHNAMERANGYGDFYNAIDNFFNDDFFDKPLSYRGFKGFRMDVKEDPEKYTIEAEMPGIKKDEISLDYNNDTLYIAVEHSKETKEPEAKEGKEEAHKDAKEKNQSKYLHRERYMTSMRRGIYLENVKKEAITAKLEEGVLTVTVPKLDKTSEEKFRINIQ